MSNTNHPHFWDCDDPSCVPCEQARNEACDQWEAEQPMREQRYRERLDAEGYYDDPEGWHARNDHRFKK